MPRRREVLDDHERESVLESVKFIFYNTGDMWTFCGETIDGPGYSGHGKYPMDTNERA